MAYRIPCDLLIKWGQRKGGRCTKTRRQLWEGQQAIQYSREERNGGKYSPHRKKLREN